MPTYEYRKRRLGHGGGGTVYEGRVRFEPGDQKRPCAVKMMYESQLDDRVIVESFAQEAALGYDLTGHPHLVGTRTFGTSANGHPYLVMDTQGPTFDHLFDAVSCSYPVIWTMAAGVCRALLACRERGYRHCDINPGNVFLGQDGRVKLGDFGKARPIGNAQPDDPDDAPCNDRRGLAVLLARFALGTVPLQRDGTLKPLPDTVPAELRTLVHGLCQPLDHGMSLEQADAFIHERPELFASPGAMDELLRYGEQLRRDAYEEEHQEDMEDDLDTWIPLEGVDDHDDHDDRRPGVPVRGDRANSDYRRDAAGIREIGAGKAIRRPRGGGGRRRLAVLWGAVFVGACVAATAVSAMYFSMRTPRVMQVDSVTVTASSVAIPEADIQPEPSSAVAADAMRERSAPVDKVRAPTIDRNDNIEPDERKPVKLRSGRLRQRMQVRPASEDGTFLLVGSATAHDIDVLMGRGLWLSHDTVIMSISVHNRSQSQYSATSPRLVDHTGRSIPITVEGSRSIVNSGLLFIVPHGIRGRLSFRVPGADRLSGQQVSLEISEPDGKRRVGIEGMRWP